MQDLDPLDTPAARIAAQVQIWSVRYRLTRREAEVLSKAASTETPAQMTSSLGIAAATVHKHRENLLRKTGDDSLPLAANRLLLEALGEACREKHRPTR